MDVLEKALLLLVKFVSCFLKLKDNRNIDTLSVKIYLICTCCETDQKNLPNTRFSMSKFDIF
jgi:hypothetical protein